MHRARRPYTSGPQYRCIAGHRTLRRGRPPYTSQYFAGLCASPPQAIYIVHICFVFYVCIFASCVYHMILDMRVYAWYYGHMTWMPTGYALIPSPSNCVWRCEDWPIRTKWASFSTAPVEKPVENSDDSGFGGLGVFHSSCHTFPQCCGKLRGWILV